MLLNWGDFLKIKVYLEPSLVLKQLMIQKLPIDSLSSYRNKCWFMYWVKIRV